MFVLNVRLVITWLASGPTITVIVSTVAANYLGPQRKRCWKCNYPQNQDIQLNSAEMHSNRLPRAGDISICGACGSFGLYMPDLTIIEPPSAVMEVIENTPEILAMRDQLMRREGM